MTDREKVIKGLECCTRGDVCVSDCPYFKEVPMTDGRCITAVQADALALLKEQEPLEPIRVEIKQAGTLYHRCYCKKCWNHVGNMVNNKVVDVHENFCSSCGQAVKWE